MRWGTRPHPDLPEFAYLEVATAPVVVRELDAGVIDLAVLDGEAQRPAGWASPSNCATKLDVCPPIVVLTAAPTTDGWPTGRGRRVRRHPIDPFARPRTVLGLLRPA